MIAHDVLQLAAWHFSQRKLSFPFRAFERDLREGRIALLFDGFDELAVGAAAEGGREVAVWLAENGYVLGTASGALIEVQAGTLKGITSLYGSSVLAGRRIITAVSS